MPRCETMTKPLTYNDRRDVKHYGRTIARHEGRQRRGVRAALHALFDTEVDEEIVAVLIERGMPKGRLAGAKGKRIAEAIGLALVFEALKGNVEAIKLVFGQTERPLPIEVEHKHTVSSLDEAGFKAMTREQRLAAINSGLLSDVSAGQGGESVAEPVEMAVAGQETALPVAWGGGAQHQIEAEDEDQAIPTLELPVPDWLAAGAQSVPVALARDPARDPAQPAHAHGDISSSSRAILRVVRAHEGEGPAKRPFVPPPAVEKVAPDLTDPLELARVKARERMGLEGGGGG